MEELRKAATGDTHEEGEEAGEGMEDCGVLPSKEQAKEVEEKPPSNSTANTSSSNSEVLEDGLSQCSKPTLQESASAYNTAGADADPSNVSLETVVLDDNSSEKSETASTSASADMEQGNLSLDSALTLKLDDDSPGKSASASTSASADMEQENLSLDSALTLKLDNDSSGKAANASTSASANMEQGNLSLDSVMTVVLDDDSSGKSATACNTASADKGSLDSELTVVLDDDSSGSNSVSTIPKSTECITASADVSGEANDSDSALTVILEKESSGSDTLPNSPKSVSSISSDVALGENKDAPSLLEELGVKPSMCGSVPNSIFESVPTTMSVAFKPGEVDLNTVHGEEVKSTTDENQNEALILNDKTLLAESLIAKLMNLLVAKRLSELKMIQNKINSRKRPISALSVAGAPCWGTSETLPQGPPPDTMTSGGIRLMDYYISQQKKGNDYNCSQLLIDNPGLEMELNYYTERMKAFIMLPIQHPDGPEEVEESNPLKRMKQIGKQAQKEDESNGAQVSETIDLS